MTLIIVMLLVLGYLLIATGHITGVNKAAIAMFLATAGWVVYICWGTDFVMSRHWAEYQEFLAGSAPSSDAVKHYIYSNVFLTYVGRAASLVMFLLATMSIVEILNNNGCFDFISEWVRTRSATRLLWTLALVTFVISANLDNLTTATMMLVIMHQMVQNHRQRMLIGTAIVLAANCGGSLTVIGDPAGLLLWGDGRVTATNYSAHLALPAIVALAVPIVLIGRMLPHRIDTVATPPPYRGDDTRLNRWQRMVMLFVGIGGLWFIPTFHNITKLSPFLGALCVLSVLWVVNEAFNRKLMDADQMAQRSVPRALQYGSIQQMLFVMAIMLAMGVMTETGVLGDIAAWLGNTVGNVWLLGIVAGLLSSIVDTFTVAVTCFSLCPPEEAVDKAYASTFVQNGDYWQVMAYATAVGGCLLTVGSVSGLALMRMEHVRMGWYLRNIAPKVLLGFFLGLLVLFAQSFF